MSKAEDNPFPYITLVEQASTPATPASGRAKFYRGTDNKQYILDDGGSPTEFGAGGGGGAAGRVLLKETILAADAASITFSSSDIPTSGYAHLEIVITGRTTQAAVSSPVVVAFNADTTDANYYRQITGINAAAAYNNAGAGREIAYLGGASATAGQGGTNRILISDYRGTTFFKTAIATVSGGANFTGTVGQNWKNTAAITSIAFTNPANFLAGTVARLYGLS